MSDTELTEVQAPQETFTWEVWQDRPAGIGDLNRHILERCGEIVSDSSYRAWSWDGEKSALAEITRLAMDSAGTFVLIHGDRVQRVSIVAETVYRLAETDES